MTRKLSSILCLLSNEKGITSYLNTNCPTRGFFVVWDGHGITHLALDFQDQYWQHSLWFNWGSKLSYIGILWLKRHTRLGFLMW